MSPQWGQASSDMMTHIRTVRLLGEEVVGQFEAIVFLNQGERRILNEIHTVFCEYWNKFMSFSTGVRGPLVLRDKGAWLVEYRRLLDKNNVGLVGSTISCESTPHVQTHVFAMHSHLFLKIIDIIDSGPRASTWLGIIAQFEVGLSTTVRYR
jgi:hypothetical protein